MRYQPLSACLLLLLIGPIVFAQTKTPSAQSPAAQTQTSVARTPTAKRSPTRPPTAPSPAKAERELLKELGKLGTLAEKQGAGEPDDLAELIDGQNSTLGSRLQRLTEEVPATLSYPFRDLVTSGMNIATSKDGLLRIYSWDALEGGTSHTYNKVYQYKIGDSIYSKMVVGDGNDDSWVSKIFILDANHKRYYLCVGHVITSSVKEYTSLQAFTLENGHLNDTTHIIKTRSGLTSTLSFDYFMDANAGDGDLFQYNDNTKTIRFPVVLEDGMVTKRKITYQFKGDYFEKVN